MKQIRQFAGIAALLLTAQARTEESPTADPETPPAPAAIPAQHELEQGGAVVGDILVLPGNIFDLEDPREDHRLYRLANALHIRTRPGVIREQLLFKSGDPYSQRLLDESERILRGARYLYDASIRPVAYSDGRVDVAVTTKDVWTLNPGVSFGRSGGKNRSGVELEELNILGTGTALSFAHKSDVDRTSTLVKYSDPHVMKTRAQIEALYSDNSDGSVRSLAARRPFYALDTRWSVGMWVMEDDEVEPLYNHGQIADEFRAHQKFAESWWGWSRGLEQGWVKRWTVGVTYDDHQFDPVAASDIAGLIPDDRKLLYPWLGFELIQDDFHKYRNHDQIGRTEDVRLGVRVRARVGWADQAYGADRDALMLFAQASHGSGTSDSATLLLSSAFRGRLEGADLRNAVLDAAVRYYVRQTDRRLFYAALEATAGHKLDLDTQILLGGDNGLRGYPLRYQTGDARALLTIEQRRFTNWYPFRLFRVGGAAFVDIGRTWGDSPVGGSDQGLLKDIGFGLRLGSSRSGLGNVVHIDLAFPLDGDSSIKHVQLLVETKQQF